MNDADFLWRYSAHESEEDAEAWMVYSGACDLGRRQYRILYGTDVVVEAELSTDDEDWQIHGMMFVQKAKALLASNTCTTFVSAVQTLLHTDPWLSTLPVLEDVD